MHIRDLVKKTAVAGLLAGLMTVSAAAEFTGIGTVKGDGLRLRSGAGTENAILTTANAGDTAMVIGEENGWYKVDFGTRVGYMSAGYVSVATQVEADLGLGMVTTSGSTLNLRTEPNSGSQVLAKLSNGAAVKLTGFDSGWFKITYNDTVGYVSGDYITPVLDSTGARKDGESAAAAPQGSSLGQKIVNEAMKHVGKRYVYATHGPNTFDCSGFSYYCVKQASGGSIVLSTSSAAQWTSAPGKRIYSISELQPGDLFFIDDPAYGGNHKIVTHVAIYAGNGMLVHASSSSTGVIVNAIKDKDRRYFVGAIRLG